MSLQAVRAFLAEHAPDLTDVTLKRFDALLPAAGATNAVHRAPQLRKSAMEHTLPQT